MTSYLLNNSLCLLCYVNVCVCAHTDTFADIHPDIQSALKCFWACGSVTFITNREHRGRDKRSEFVWSLHTTGSGENIWHHYTIKYSPTASYSLKNDHGVESTLCDTVSISLIRLKPGFWCIIAGAIVFFPSINRRASINPLHPKPWWWR